MRDVLEDLVGWWQAGETVGMGTVVATWRSAPRPAGASMLVGPDGTAVGSVSGGCVEGAVYEEAKDAVETGVPTLERYGVSDDDAFAVGLTCGGILDVFVESISRESFPELGEVAESVDRHEPVAVVTVVKGPDDRLGRRLVLWPDRSSGTLGLQRLDDAVAADARGMLVAGRTGLLHVGHDGERRGDDLTLFVNSFAPPRGWSSSARSTSPRRSPGSAPSWGIG
ncbi:XdhC family protein [Blastococcus brunescens]|uniref:XdhC family protein n=1 Tax=Blastococcus brunescens TaxID=1564165 RepID=A0ABZ1B034_9ACTN|nr:XdhC family protein [Blastococcus sp. BMG 8361]WRL63546.1 XdhC family protein [Blastococcus sp. BMG 8361]